MMSFRDFKNNIFRFDLEILEDFNGFSFSKSRIINSVRMDVDKYLLAGAEFSNVIKGRFTAYFFQGEKQSFRLGKGKKGVGPLKITVFRASDQSLPAQDGG